MLLLSLVKHADKDIKGHIPSEVLSYYLPEGSMLHYLVSHRAPINYQADKPRLSLVLYSTFILHMMLMFVYLCLSSTQNLAVKLNKPSLTKLSQIQWERLHGERTAQY